MQLLRVWTQMLESRGIAHLKFRLHSALSVTKLAGPKDPCTISTGCAGAELLHKT